MTKEVVAEAAQTDKPGVWSYTDPIKVKQIGIRLR